MVQVQAYVYDSPFLASTFGAGAGAGAFSSSTFLTSTSGFLASTFGGSGFFSSTFFSSTFGSGFFSATGSGSGFVSLITGAGAERYKWYEII